MEKDATEKLLGIYEINDNSFNVVFYVFKTPLDMCYNIICKFTLNSKPYTFETQIKDCNFSSEPSIRTFIAKTQEILLKELSEIFTMEFLSCGSFKQAVHNGRIY